MPIMCDFMCDSPDPCYYQNKGTIIKRDDVWMTQSFAADWWLPAEGSDWTAWCEC